MTLCAAIIGVASVMVPSGSATAVDRNPNSINCPASPAKWNNPPVSKTVNTPGTIPEPSALEHWAQGGVQVTVTCSYHDTMAKQVQIAVSYALTVDPNPANDFDFGCGNGAVTWDTTNRVYRAASTKDWAIATIDDSADSLPASDVSTFETMTRKLLQNAEGYGHSCTLVTKPTKVAASLYFDVLVDGTTVQNTFFTSQTKNKDGSFPITKVTVTTIPFHVQTNQGKHLLAVKLTSGIDYVAPTTHVAGRARFRVVVTNTKVSSCHKGATGILTMSTSTPRASLTVCGQTFLRDIPVEPVVFSN